MTTLAQWRRDPRRPVWQERPSVAGQGAKAGTMAVILLLVLLPMHSIVLTSFSTQASINIAGDAVACLGRSASRSGPAGAGPAAGGRLGADVFGAAEMGCKLGGNGSGRNRRR